jgi:hypothetical protein
VGKLDGFSDDKQSQHFASETPLLRQIVLDIPKTPLAVFIFALRLTCALWSIFIFTMYTWAGFSRDGSYVNFTDRLQGTDFVKGWHLLSMITPYLLTSALLYADLGALGCVLFGLLSTAWVMQTAITKANLVDGDINSPFQVALFSVPVVLAALGSLYFYARRRGFSPFYFVIDIAGPQRPHRVALLYARYFGINGSLFTWKTAFLQTVRVMLQAYAKLLLVGQFTTGESPFTTACYWLSFSVLVLNAIIINVLLHSKNDFVQRVVVCYVDIALDLLYSIAAPGEIEIA